jgi:uroporphyrinogen decarboxylase
VVEQTVGVRYAHLLQGDLDDRRSYYRLRAEAFRDMGYDVVPFEQCICGLINGARSLSGHEPGPVQNRADFERFPWAELPDRFFSVTDESYQLLAETMPEGMKAVGGVGNGVFELIQDTVRYTELCMLRMDDPELYGDLFQAIGDLMLAIWERFMRDYAEAFCVFRFGDDLGFKTSTLLHPDDIRRYVLPQYKRIVDLVHSHGQPFLLHSCGNIFEVMDDIIDTVGIDAKHSNEDDIAPFREWVERYGDRIGNFGGIDMNVIVQGPVERIGPYVRDVLEKTAVGHGGIAIGTGNSIADYVPPRFYAEMLRTVREFRGE